MSNSVFRNGVTGALLDVYQQAIVDFSVVTTMLPGEAFTDRASFIYEKKVTIHYIITHTIESGYIYADHIRVLFQLPTAHTVYDIKGADDVSVQLNHVLAYTEEALKDTFNMSYEQINEILIYSSWGKVYDLEMLLEHAIVHIYRHERQLKKYMSGRKNKGS